MPAASAIHAWPFIKLCTCQPRPGAFRHPAQSSQFRLQWYTCNRQAAPLRLSPAAQAVSTVATESSAQQQPLQSAQASQGHQRDTSSNTGNTSLQQQQVSNNLNSRPTADLLDPRSYEGTSDKARRKELVKYLASIPESEMTPEMLRRWRISKANRGKQAWNFGRRHPPGKTPACTLTCLPA